MGYVHGVDRNHAWIVAVGVMVASSSSTRDADAFVGSLVMGGLGFTPPAAEGRPSFGPRPLLKL